MIDPLKFRVKSNKSQIEGRGAFAGQTIAARKKIGHLSGEIVSIREGRKRAAAIKRIALVEFGNGKAIDASVSSNALRYINHSCDPNTFMRVRFPYVEFYSLRTISAGTELTCDYGDTHHEGRLPCRCGTTRCRKFL